MTRGEERPWSDPAKPGRLDADGVEWWACDPYPRWYRREGGQIRVRREGCVYRNPLVHQCDDSCEDKAPTPWAKEEKA